MNISIGVNVTILVRQNFCWQADIFELYLHLVLLSIQ